MIKTTTLAEEELKRLVSETEGATGVRIYNSGG